uniref:Uncharacterized protein n=1 Tax=Oryza glumipatula TaxID=40148 RepID=A0A0D9YA45_9ORYZ
MGNARLYRGRGTAAAAPPVRPKSHERGGGITQAPNIEDDPEYIPIEQARVGVPQAKKDSKYDVDVIIVEWTLRMGLMEGDA